MEILDEYVLTKLKLDNDDKIISVNARTFDTHDAKAHQDAVQ